MNKKFNEWFSKSNLEYSNPYNKKDLEKAFSAGKDEMKSELIEELFQELDNFLSFYPIGGVCRPVMTEFEIKKFKEYLKEKK